jgi:hypothetical protein
VTLVVVLSKSESPDIAQDTVIEEQKDLNLISSDDQQSFAQSNKWLIGVAVLVILIIGFAIWKSQSRPKSSGGPAKTDVDPSRTGPKAAYNVNDYVLPGGPHYQPIYEKVFKNVGSYWEYLPKNVMDNREKNRISFQGANWHNTNWLRLQILERKPRNPDTFDDPKSVEVSVGTYVDVD